MDVLFDPSLRVRMYRETVARHQKWNQTVAKRAVKIDTSNPRYVKVLHPTKGYRYIARERLGL